MSRFRRWMLHQRTVKLIIGLLIFLLIWQILALYNNDPNVLPTVTSVAASLWNNFDSLKVRIFETGMESVLSFGIAFFIAAVVASLFEEFRIADSFLSPTLTAFQVIPKVAIAPLLVIWLKSRMGPTLAMGTLIAFFPIYEGIREGLRSDKTGLRRTLAVLRPNRFRVFWEVKVPEAIPLICAGARIGVTFAVVGVIVGEMARPSTGLGYIVQEAKDSLAVSTEFAAICLVSILGAALYLLIQTVAHSRSLARFFPENDEIPEALKIEGGGHGDSEL